MKRSSRLLGCLTALALLTVPLAALAPASAQSSGPAEDFDSVTASLADGDAEAASSTYQETFAGPADHAPTAKQNVEDALATASQLDPDATEYALAAKTVEKGLLAVSYHATVQAALAGDGDTARAHLDVLTTAFDEGTFADAEAAFEGAQGEALADAAATLNTSYREHVALETLHEAEEVPELIEAGETDQAAAEAAEAGGYALGLNQAVEASLGTDRAEDLRAHLGNLTQAALAEDADAAATAAEQVSAIVAEHGLATLPDEKFEAFHAYKDQLGEDRFEDAQATLDEAFGEEGREYAPEAFDSALEALAAAENATTEERAADRTVQGQIAKKSVLEVAWTVGFHELREGEIHEGLEYVAVNADKFGWTEDRPERAHPLGLTAATGEAGAERVDAIRDALGDKHADKVREETEEVFINWDDVETAREKAIEGVLYAAPAEAYFEAELGVDATSELLEEVDALYQATTDRDRDTADEAADEILTLLDQLAAGEGASDLEKVLVDLEGKIDFVAEEYRGYHEAKEAGDEGEAETEMGEARAFTNRSLSVVEENADMLQEADAEAYDTLVAHLEETEAILDDTGSLEALEAEVDAALEALDAFRATQASGPAVDVEIGTAEPADGAFVIPVRLVGVPEAGFSFQAQVGYDANAVTVEDVEVPADVGASTVEEDTVRFNAAGTGLDASTVTVARLTVQPVDASTEASFDVSVETLTDEAGEPMRQGNVTGTTVTMSDTGSGQAPAPAPGALVLVTVLGGLAALTRR